MQPKNPQTILCLMGPTATGKTGLALQLAACFPVEIISVDSALVYTDMNIGTAKPSDAERAAVPHHLIDICVPTEAYSVGQFIRDVQQIILQIHQRGNIPLLVGGTMLYFHGLLNGSAQLPSADEVIRSSLLAEAQTIGWQAMHVELAKVDPITAERVHPNDPQRIQRALEVYRLTGQPMSQLQQHNQVADYRSLVLSLEPIDRALLHQRIEQRLALMFEGGLVDEVRSLRKLYSLNADCPAMRCVGYRQVWQFLEGVYDESTMRYKALVATRQLAKRQLTWLRRWQDIQRFSMESDSLYQDVKHCVSQFLEAS